MEADEDLDLIFECDLCGEVVRAICICETCMSSRCEPCHDVHGCNCPPYVIA